MSESEIPPGFAVLSKLGELCPDYDINCLHSYIYDKPSDYYIESKLLHYFVDTNKSMKISMNFYTLYQMDAYNCFVITHHDPLPTGSIQYTHKDEWGIELH